MKEKEEQRLNMLKAEEEKIYIEKNMKYICGIDEAGRGPLAGPVVVGAVVMPRDSKIEWVNDSKKVTEKRREILYDKITEEALANKRRCNKIFNFMCINYCKSYKG